VERSLRVLDGAVAVFDAVAGVEPQTETVWRQANKYKVPRICFVNKMDRVGADYFRTVDMIRDRLEATVALTQLPVGSENDFRGVVDLLTMRAHVWQDGMGDSYETVEIPEEMKADAEHWRHELVDVVSHHDDTVLEKYVGDEEITAEDLKRGLRASTIAGEVVPVLCGSAFKNKAVQPLLDAIVDYLPSPLEVLPVVGHDPKTEDVLQRPADDSEPFSALAFKIMSDPYVGKLTYFRVYSGKLAAGGQVMNVTKNRRERVGRLLQMHANHREDKQAVFAGDIVAAVGLKHTTTGDTLSDPTHPVLLERMEFPEPVISVAIEPKTKADQDKLGKALGALSEEDPTFQVRTDDDTGQTIISGMGELHLEVLVDRMMREFTVSANVGKPQVAYRETITVPVEKIEERYVRQTGGRGQYGHVIINLEPTGPGGGYEFVDKVTGGDIPREYIPAVDAGIQQAMDGGVIAGYPLVDMRATLTGGQEGGAPGQAGAARADHGGRGRHARGLHGRRDRRPVIAPGQDRRDGAARERASRPFPSAVGGDVRLRYRSPLAHPGSSDVHDAVRLVPAGARVDRRRDHRPYPGRVTT
jgi:elongation factor G